MKTTKQTISEHFRKLEPQSGFSNHDFYYEENKDDDCLRYNIVATKKGQKEIVATSWGNLRIAGGLREVKESIVK